MRPARLLTPRLIDSPCHPLQRLPERIVEKAVQGMLPKGSLGRDIRLHLKVYKGTAHPHEAQQPIDITTCINNKPRNAPDSVVAPGAPQ